MGSGVALLLYLYYLRVKLQIQSKFVVESFNEKRGTVEVFARLEHSKIITFTTGIIFYFY